MAGRNRLPPHPHLHAPPPPPPAQLILEDRMAAQFDDIQALLADNQRLAATHVALKQECQLVQYELRRTSAVFDSSRAEGDLRLREVYEKMVKMENELGSIDSMKAELMRVRADVQKLTGARKELMDQVQALTKDLTRVSTDARQVPAVKTEVEGLKQEIQRVREAIEQEKKGYAENYEQGQVMEKNLISMAREVEKLRAELANSDKRAHTNAQTNQVANYGANYVGTDTNYMANPYAAVYGINPAQGNTDPAMQYVWGTYDMQRNQARR
ncbi:hypothetical protein LUZ60_010805 [Juncus effusus]|nr:hypothetical protein LUZ60_010805 [Juncus effusus]